MVICILETSDFNMIAFIIICLCIAGLNTHHISKDL